MRPLLQVSAATIYAPGGRVLFDALSLQLAREHVALVGRNGVGKSTLLAVLAGAAEPDSGRVQTFGTVHFVPQVSTGSALDAATGARAPSRSQGELRRQGLAAAQWSGADILLLDEPSEHLDEAAVAWLKGWLTAWPGCLVMASHDRRLLADFRHFFIASESGSRYFSGTLAELDGELEREHQQAQQRYLRNLNRLAAQQAHTEKVARRKARKQRYGRCSELDRATSRVRLNQKRSDAQVSHGRLAKLREARLDALQQWSLSTRRTLPVNLSLELPAPTLPPPTQSLLVLRNVSASVQGRCLFQGLDLELGRQRLAVIGPNGGGKTTLLEILLGRRAPSTGSASREPSRMGAIAQGGADWMLEDTLLSYLGAQPYPTEQRSSGTQEELEWIAAHKFPLALAERPLRSLSPGERTRAALICLFRRAPPIELLILDEPTYSLDLVGQRALVEALRAWPGGLVVASHDREFLSAIGVEKVIELGSAGPIRERA